MTDPGGEAHRLPFALQPYPARVNVDQRVEGVVVERGAAQGEEDQQTLEFHGFTLRHRWGTIVIR
jgi:hypothetical protein